MISLLRRGAKSRRFYLHLSPQWIKIVGKVAEQKRNTRTSWQKATQPITDFGRIQPQAVEVEEVVLGALMIEKDAYCNDILIQSAAASAAINAFNKELLCSHIKNCVTRDIRNGDDQVIDELMETLYKLMK